MRRVGDSASGLAIVRRLCALLEHRLDVASAPGAGSRFSVTLAARGAPAIASPRSRNTAATESRTAPIALPHSPDAASSSSMTTRRSSSRWRRCSRPGARASRQERTRQARSASAGRPRRPDRRRPSPCRRRVGDRCGRRDSRRAGLPGAGADRVGRHQRNGARRSVSPQASRCCRSRSSRRRCGWPPSGAHARECGARCARAPRTHFSARGIVSAPAGKKNARRDWPGGHRLADRARPTGGTARAVCRNDFAAVSVSRLSRTAAASAGGTTPSSPCAAGSCSSRRPSVPA